MSKSDTPSVTIPPLAKGEIYAGIVVVRWTPLHHLILLPGETRANWKDALAWAKEKNAELPTRVEQALLFSNAADQFGKEWYWSAEPYAGDASSAWFQLFGSGFQNYSRQTRELRARAVRRVVI